SWVRRYKAAGFQQMKVYSSMSLDAVRLVAEAAHREGMTVTGHVPEGLNAYQTIEAGQDQINHVHFIGALVVGALPVKASRSDRMTAFANIDLDSPETEKAMGFLVSHHTVVDPTIALVELSTVTSAKPVGRFEPGAEKVPQELAGRLQNVGPPTSESELREKVFTKCLGLVGKLHRAGVPIVAGTDQAVPGHSLHRELELYVEAGMTPREAIQAATRVPARVMGLANELGTIEVGKRADLIIVKGNPLNDISQIRNVELVVTGGKIYRTDELWRSVGFLP
ncbi:MAG: amidohydrolase family protein, partial [Thermoplasmata archaeon]